MPVYNYNKLRGLIREHFGTLDNYADYIGISYTSLQDRLNSRLPFKQDEIEKSIKGLKINPKDIDIIFFAK
ncbi:DUF739 family protein [Helcococcus kunzii]|uniref:HTH cro/C1-type domain-containing protein n=1 Tax=Helcococcus kunzii ATCC 51366 TaxID=883114 RepID=H3NPG0_9FIRM|nr:DUF739 family protein [Helcococcus kunzii]EHR33473.1 hypothetical protein HMPREF9709_01221 [Helcococcus kunzii ATCC 51366]